MDFTQFLLTIPAITATVQWLKALGVNGKWAQLSAVTVGIVFSIATTLTLYNTAITAIDTAIWINAIFKGFMYGLAAAGFYDLANGNYKPNNETKGRHAQ